MLSCKLELCLPNHNATQFVNCMCSSVVLSVYRLNLRVVDPCGCMLCSMTSLWLCAIFVMMYATQCSSSCLQVFLVSICQHA